MSVYHLHHIFENVLLKRCISPQYVFTRLPKKPRTLFNIKSFDVSNNGILFTGADKETFSSKRRLPEGLKLILKRTKSHTRKLTKWDIVLLFFFGYFNALCFIGAYYLPWARLRDWTRTIKINRAIVSPLFMLEKFTLSSIP